MRNKGADHLRNYRAFVFTTWIVQFLFCLYPNFKLDSSFLLRLCRPFCVRPGRKTRRPVYSRRGSFLYFIVLVFFLMTDTENKSQLANETCLCNIQGFLLIQKFNNFQMKIFDIFLLFDQNIA